MVFCTSSSPYTVSSAYLRAAFAALSTAEVSRPANFIVFLNLSTLSLMFTTSPANPVSLSHSFSTPLVATLPMNEPKAAAFRVAFSNALTASFELPVMRTLMIAECPMRPPPSCSLFVHSFGLFLQQAQGRGPVLFKRAAAPFPRGAARVQGEQHAQLAQGPGRPRAQAKGSASPASSSTGSMSSTASSHVSNGSLVLPLVRRSA